MKKKVLYLGVSSNRGGIETLALDILKGINKEFFEIDFLTSYNRISIEDELEVLGSKIHKINRTSGLYGKIQNFKNYYMFFKEHKEYTIVHNHLMRYQEIEIILAQKISGIKNIIIHSHSSGADKLNWKGKLFEKISKNITLLLADKFISCSTESSEFMYNKLVTEGDNYLLLENRIDIDKFKFNKANRTRIRNDYSLNELVVYIHIGAFLRVKNHNFLIDLFNEIVKHQNDAHLILVGSGVMTEEIRDKVDDLTLSSKVTFVGSVNNVEDYLSASDYFILPSFSEGMPISVIEAQCSGLKCYISDIITNEVILTDLVEKLNLNSGIEKWSKLILNSQHLYDRYKYSEEFSRKVLGVDGMVKKMEYLYNNLV